MPRLSRPKRKARPMRAFQRMNVQGRTCQQEAGFRPSVMGVIPDAVIHAGVMAVVVGVMLPTVAAIDPTQAGHAVAGIIFDPAAAGPFLDQALTRHDRDHHDLSGLNIARTDRRIADSYVGGTVVG